MSNNIAIFGAGGFGREVACVVNELKKNGATWNFIGFFDDGLEVGTELGYGKVLGGVDELNNIIEPLNVFVAIGKPDLLRQIVTRITNPLIQYPNIIASSVNFYDRDSVKMGRGNFIGPNSSVSCGVTFGDFNLLNVFSQVGHDATFGNYNVIMPSVNISGAVEMGDGNLFGAKSIAIQCIKVGAGVTIAPNSVLTRNAKDGKTYIGNPAKIFV